jgi:hypothetical protein
MSEENARELLEALTNASMNVSGKVNERLFLDYHAANMCDAHNEQTVRDHCYAKTGWTGAERIPNSFTLFYTDGPKIARSRCTRHFSIARSDDIVSSRYPNYERFASSFSLFCLPNSRASG